MPFSTVFFILISSCKKGIKVDEATYEAKLINSTTWGDQYLDANANVVTVNNGPDNWRYTFKNANELTMLTTRSDTTN